MYLTFLDPNVNESQIKQKKGDIIRFKPPSKERIAALRAYRLIFFT